MIAYLDTSALLRLVLGETDALEQLRSAEGLVSSELRPSNVCANQRMAG